MEFNFTPLSRGNFRQERWDHDAVTVTPNAVVVGSVPTSRLGSRQVTISIDTNRKAIKLTPSTNGYVFRRISGGRLRIANRKLLKQLPMGDYAHIGDNVFVSK